MAEEIITPMGMVNNILGMMNWGGYNPRNRTKLRVVLGFTICFYTMFTFILQGIYLATNKYEDYGFILIDVLMLTGFWQLSVKAWTIFSKYQPLQELIDTIEYKFWSSSNLPHSQRVATETVYKIAKLGCLCQSIGVITTTLGHIVTSYFRGPENLVMNIWMPESLKEWNRTPIGHSIIFGAEFLIFGSVVITALNTIDPLYIILISLVLGQLKILKYKLMTISEKESVDKNINEIAECVEHHNLLFDFLHGIEDIFSTELLNVAGSVIIIAVMSMYSGISEKDIVRIVIFYFMFFIAMSQLFIYCIMGQLIQDETLSVADSAYMCKWEGIPDKNLRLSLMLMIQRSQKYVQITMGGLVILSFETFTGVSRFMLSLLMFMMNSEVGK